MLVASYGLATRVSDIVTTAATIKKTLTIRFVCL